jgi:hypothetical protein
MHASHSSRDVTAESHANAHEMAPHDHQTSNSRPVHDPTPLGGCTIPCAPAACGSAVTCSVTAAELRASDSAPAQFASIAAVAPDALVPRSLTTAPETPPPRA